MGLYSYVLLYRLRQQHRQLHRNYLQNTEERFVSKKFQSSAIHHANLIIGFFNRWRLDQFRAVALPLFGHPWRKFHRANLRNG